MNPDAAALPSDPERERLLRELEAERARLRELIMRAPAAISLSRGPEHVAELQNDLFREIIGGREISGLTVHEAFPELQGQGFFELLDEVYRTGKAFTGREMPVTWDRHGNGRPEQGFMNVVYQPLRDADGEVYGVLSHSVEVTDQVAARRGVERLEERYRSLIRALAEIVWITDSEGAVEDLPEWRAYTGQSPEEVRGWGWLDAIHPDDRAHTAAVWKRAVETKGAEPYNPEYRIRGADGTYRWFHARGVPVREEDGRVREWVGVCVDVDIRKRAEAALRTSEERFRAVQETSPDGFMIFRSVRDSDDRITDFEWIYANPSAERMVGRTDAQLRGRRLLVEMPGNRESGLFDRYREVVETGRTQQWEFHYEHEGLNHWFRSTAAGAGDGFAVSFADVTARNEAEGERERLIELLAASNHELDQFAYVASHDLKAPLRGIANLSQWIEEDLGAEAVSAEVREHLELLRGRVHRMGGLIDGILAYSRAGRVRDAEERVEVGELLAEVWDLLAPPPEFRLTLGEGMPTLVTERLPLQQVFMNLLGNAVKYAGVHDPEVRVTVRREGSFREFAVADSGPGIAPEYHERIFGIFQTLHARDQVEGTGIGLSLVRKIVERKGGRVWVESAPGAGATFRFLWPDDVAGGSP